MIEQTRVIERVPEVTTEETKVTEPVAQDTAAITQAMKLVPNTRGDVDEAMNNSRVKSVLKRETIDRQPGSDAKETGKEKSVQKPVKKVIALSGGALLLIFLFIAYNFFNGPASKPEKSTPFNEKRRVNDADLVENGTGKISNDVDHTKKSTTTANGMRNNTTPPHVKLSKNTIAVYFSTPETFWINIKNEGGGKVISHRKMIKGSNEPVYLPIGKYRLTFKSAEGGEMVDSFFNVTNEMLIATTHTFQLNFKKPLAKPLDNPGVKSSDNAGVNPINSARVNPSNSAGVNPADNSGINASNNAGVNPSNSAGVNPADNSGINASNNAGVNPSNSAGVNPSNNSGINPSNNTINPPNPTFSMIKELAANMVTVPAGSFTMGDSTKQIRSLRPVLLRLIL
jgi:hypothetical protein